MKTYFGGDKVQQGMYFNMKSGEFLDITEKATTLPGTNLNKFAKVPRWLPFIAGPAIGLFFVIFLPLAGIVGLVSGAAIKARIPNVLHTAGNRRTADIK
jgi:hypothetical protein